MHILFLIHSLKTGGAERFTANMANHWARAGHRVSVVTFVSRDDDSFALDPAITRISLGYARTSTGMVDAIGGNIRRLRALNRCLQRQSPDVAIGIMATAAVLLALSGAPCLRIGSERAYPPSLPLGRLREGLRRHLYRRLDAVVAQTGETADWLRQKSNARQVAVLPNPVSYPLEASAPHRDPGTCLRHGRKRLLTVGRLDPVKGYDRLIAAFAALAPAHPEWDLVILGDGPDRPRLENQRAASGCAERIHLPGRAGNVADWYRSADLFTLTSLNEGFPNVLIEAMAHGLAVVSVDCQSGPRDLIRPGIDGLLVPQADPAALQSALAALMADSARRSAMAARAIEARDRFAIETIAAGWEALFTAAASDPDRGR